MPLHLTLARAITFPPSRQDMQSRYSKQSWAQDEYEYS